MMVLINDRGAYRRFMRDHCGGKAADHHPFPPTNGGSCQKIVKGEACIFIIAVGPQKDTVELASTLAHEATHAMRWIFEHIGEAEPGTETQAYLVESIVRQGLIALA